MKPYQEKLLKLAGFAPQEYDGVIVWWHPEGTLVNEGYVEEGANCYTFNSLDWLERWIMPAVKEEYNVWLEMYRAGQYIFYDYEWGDIAVGEGGSKIEALNNALEMLVDEKNAVKESV